MSIIIDSILSGRYRLCQKLGQGRSSEVYLAVHQELEEYRAIKCVSKDCVTHEQFMREARILRDLRHPGIPIIYDLTEDDQFSYLIEEYIVGETLQAIVSMHGPLSRTMTIRYGIQICHLVYFVHSARPNPILFLDLQPQNLLLCNETLKLIDFGQAVLLSEASTLNKRYGTVGYAAPEQYNNEVLDERTDLYAIGAVLYFMLTGQQPQAVPSYPRSVFDAALEQVIRRCLNHDKELRYDSAADLADALQRLLKPEQRGYGGQADSFLSIAVAGVKAGIGSTHVAIGLSAYLKQCSLSVRYEEHNSSNAVRIMAARLGIEAGRDGLYQIHGLVCCPRYGPAVQQPEVKEHNIISDYGTDWSAIPLHQTDVILLICGSRIWEQEAVQAAYDALKNHPGLILLFNHPGMQKIILPSQAKRSQCFPLPYFPNPYCIQPNIETIYAQALKAALKERREWHKPCCGIFGWQSIKQKVRRLSQKRLEL